MLTDIGRGPRIRWVWNWPNLTIIEHQHDLTSQLVTTYYHHNSHRDQEKPVSTVRPIHEMDRRLNRTPDPPLPPCRMIKTGPNDASGVVWATGMYFLFYNRVLLILTNFFTLSRLYLPHNNTGKVGLCCGDQNGPKRRQMRRLGHRYVFLFCNRFFMDTT